MPVVGLAMIVLLMTASGAAPLIWTYATGNYSWTVAVSHDGQYLIAGSDDMHAYFFKIDAGANPVWTHSAQGYVRHVAISSNGSSAAASDMAGNVYFFRPEASGSPAWSFHASSAISGTDISEDGHRLVVGDEEGDIYLFDTDGSGSPMWQNFVMGGVLALSLFRSDSVAVASAKGGIYFYNLTSSRPGYAWSFQDSMSFPQLAVSDSAGYIVAGGSDGNIYVTNSAGQVIDMQKLGGSISAISIADHAGCVILGSTNGSVSRYLLKDRLEKLDSSAAHGPITSVAVSDDGSRLSVASLDGTISDFHQTLNDLSWTFSAGAIVHSLSMSGDGLVMAASSDTGKIYLFSEHASAQTQDSLPVIVYALVSVAALLLAYFVLRARLTRVR
jgi:WD40 repeat protein